MDKFLDKFLDEIEFVEVVPANTSTITSLAGGTYFNHVKEINNMIDAVSKNNADTYRKASFCAIG